ncbi:alpha-L-fucosidase C-terminal domain-containing protein [Aureibaculum sp. 2210JD6-5]|nr:alpha-L-fucosidase C-terminal domain-containing protein [Aureibaculum sp. 2210JD6-5]MDY7396908.1 alpha-L-fucosidase C-terminal domain-containing protein [Aureibaculum sp. 2210JD6-5]
MYAIMMAWPENSKVTIKSIKESEDKVKSVSLLGSDAKLNWKQTK